MTRDRFPVSSSPPGLQSGNRFRAPWSAQLTVATLMPTGFCLAIFISYLPAMLAQGPESTRFWYGLVPLLIPPLAALFTVRGYEITSGELLIRRPFWSTGISLLRLQRAEVVPGVMLGSIRTFGNNGFFSYLGRFRNDRLGSYRAYVTDPRRTVVMSFAAKTIVVSPDRPEEFVTALRPFVGMGGGPSPRM